MDWLLSMQRFWDSDSFHFMVLSSSRDFEASGWKSHLQPGTEGRVRMWGYGGFGSFYCSALIGPGLYSVERSHLTVNREGECRLLAGSGETEKALHSSMGNSWGKNSWYNGKLSSFHTNSKHDHP